MKTMRRSVLKAAVAGASMGLTGLAGNNVFAQGATFKYKVATNVPLTHPIYIRLTEASEKIKEETAGKVSIQVFPNGQLGSDTDMLTQIRLGGVDFLTLPGVILANLVPMASLNSVGFAFSDYPSVWKAMDGELGKYIRGEISKSNLHVFDKVWDNGFRQMTASKPINSPADLVDLKIRVPVSPLLVSLFKSLRASPTPINFNELYSALQTKVVDAQENPLSIINTGKLYEVQKYCALTSHVWDGYWLLANNKSYKGLPDNLRLIVDKNFNEAAVRQRSDSEALALSLQKELADKGMLMNTPSKDAFRQALQQANFYSEWKAKFGDVAWGHLEAAVGKLA